MLDKIAPSKSDRIRELNDHARQTFTGCAVMLTASLAQSCAEVRAEVLHRVREFKCFNADNDPHGEHDFGSFQVGKQTFNWQFSYYDLPMEFGSPDPANPAVTQRVLTIGPASDW